LTPEKNVK